MTFPDVLITFLICVLIFHLFALIFDVFVDFVFGVSLGIPTIKPSPGMNEHPRGDKLMFFGRIAT